MGETAEVGTRSSGRRAFLRRAGLVTGGVWAAPVIQSLTTPAYAGSDQPCAASFWFRHSRGAGGRAGSTSVLSGPNPSPTGTCDPPGLAAATGGVTAADGTSGTFGSGSHSGSFSIAVSGSVLTVTLSSTTGCRLLATVESGGTCTPLSRTASGVYSASVADPSTLTMSALICC